MSLTRLDPRSIRDISGDILDENGQMRIMPADYYRKTTVNERALFGHTHGIYSFPTLELIEWLHRKIGSRVAIEIGAGNGVMAKELGIPATDSMLQTNPLVAKLYSFAGQPAVKYGENVEKLDAVQAIEKYRPQVVVAAWVTHMYRKDRHEAGGNMFGVVEENIIDCADYIFIGNRGVHSGKSIWSVECEVIEPDWLFSRATNGAPNFIATWKKN
jgi:hypothetical protein